VREGHYEAALVARQADKADPEQTLIASILPRFEPAERVVDHIIVGCGPAGLALAAEVASHGISVALLGMHAILLLH
jgi:lycopene epsilon-cyclase